MIFLSCFDPFNIMLTVYNFLFDIKTHLKVISYVHPPFGHYYKQKITF